MSRDHTCVVCDMPLTGNLDTYGDDGIEMCWTCYSLWRLKCGFTFTPGLVEHAGEIILGEDEVRR